MLLVGTAIGADRSEFDLIGYSPDGKFFAFEEFGIQDGSGFPHSTIFIIDVAEDKWVAGAPYRTVVEDELGDLHGARSLTRSAAQHALEALNITHPAQILAFNADGEPPHPELSLPFNIPGHTGIDAMWGDYRLDISVFDAPSSDDCTPYLEDGSKGFALSLADGALNTIIYKDTNVPSSRGCPIAYRVTAVAIPFEDARLTNAIALISVWAYGFEGPDRRFIAVPLNYEN